jgi:hypothetical protein
MLRLGRMSFPTAVVAEDKHESGSATALFVRQGTSWPTAVLWGLRERTGIRWHDTWSSMS